MPTSIWNLVTTPTNRQLFLATLTFSAFTAAVNCFSESDGDELVKIPNFCNDCTISGCLHDGKCQAIDGRCECQQGFWGNRCQYRTHEMYKFGKCPSPKLLGQSAHDWPQLQPDGCQFDSDCPGLWKCCPSFVSTSKEKSGFSPVGTRSCTQPWLNQTSVPQLPLCLQHLWNITDSGRSYSGCDMLMCDETTGGRAFDRWQCNYCDGNSTTCFCFINFDNDGKYWGELPGSRQKLDNVGSETTDRPGVIHRMPKHQCSLQDRCPQMFPHGVFCTHGIQRDTSGCPTGECLRNPEEKCFTSCSAGYLCEHRTEPEQINHWHCVDTFRPFRLSVEISEIYSDFVEKQSENVANKAAHLVARVAIVDESIVHLMANATTMTCLEDSKSKSKSVLRATTAASAYVVPVRDRPNVVVLEIVGQVAFSASFNGSVIRKELLSWIESSFLDHAQSASSKLGTTSIVLIVVACLISLLLVLLGSAIVMYRRRLSASEQFSLSSESGNHQAFSNPTHGHDLKNRPTALTHVGHVPEFGSSSSGASSEGSVSPKNSPVNDGYQAF